MAGKRGSQSAPFVDEAIFGTVCVMLQFVLQKYPQYYSTGAPIEPKSDESSCSRHLCNNLELQLQPKPQPAPAAGINNTRHSK